MPEGRRTAALVHLLTMVFWGPLLPIGLLVTVVAGTDRRPLVRHAAHASRWFDLLCVGLLGLGVWLLAGGVSDDAGAAVIILTVLTFVGSHLVGAVQALRGKAFRYPVPWRARRRVAQTPTS